MSLGLRRWFPETTGPYSKNPPKFSKEGGVFGRAFPRPTAGAAFAGKGAATRPAGSGSGAKVFRHRFRATPPRGPQSESSTGGQLGGAANGRVRLTNPSHRGCTGFLRPEGSFGVVFTPFHRSPPRIRVGQSENPPGSSGLGVFPVGSTRGGSPAVSLRRTEAGQLRGFSPSLGGASTQSGFGPANRCSFPLSFSFPIFSNLSFFRGPSIYPSSGGAPRAAFSAGAAGGSGQTSEIPFRLRAPFGGQPRG
jgi:hypothetical protein